jgi:hypothetical protein
LVSGADARVVLSHESFGISALTCDTTELMPKLKFGLARRSHDQTPETPIEQAG